MSQPFPKKEHFIYIPHTSDHRGKPCRQLRHREVNPTAGSGIKLINTGQDGARVGKVVECVEQCMS
jgi:hypothetical protein